MTDDPLTSLQSLSPGWNGYAAPPPSAASIAAARAFVDALGRLPGPADVEPSVAGGALVTVRGIDRARRVVVEFLKDGEIVACFLDGVSEPKFLGVAEWSLARVIAAYLGLETEARTDG